MNKNPRTMKTRANPPIIPPTIPPISAPVKLCDVAAAVEGEIIVDWRGIVGDVAVGIGVIEGVPVTEFTSAFVGTNNLIVRNFLGTEPVLHVAILDEAADR